MPDELLQAIAEENNLSETAFYVAEGDAYRLRWFTPLTEVDLCGHATLAAAHVLFASLGTQEVTFLSRSGELTVTREGALLTLNSPTQEGTRCETPKPLVDALGVEPLACYQSMDYMVVLESEAAVAELKPNFRLLAELDLWGVIVTARQLSRRGGELLCRVEGSRVFISGHTAAYLEGLIEV